MRVNLDKQLIFPENITSTSLRLRTILFSDKSKQLVMLELTVPWEERLEEASEKRDGHTQSWWKNAMDGGSVLDVCPLKWGVGASQEVCRACSLLGITGAHKRKAINMFSGVAEKASEWFRIMRGKELVNAFWNVVY